MYYIASDSSFEMIVTLNPTNLRRLMLNHWDTKVKRTKTYDKSNKKPIFDNQLAYFNKLQIHQQ